MEMHTVDGVICRRWLAVLATSVVCCSNVFAAQWQYDPKIEVTGIYDDNHHMDDVSANKVSVSGGELETGVEIHGRWPSSSLLFAPSIYSSYFPGKSDENANDQYAVFAVDHDGEKTKSALQADYSRRTLLKEFLPDTSVNGDLGQAAPGTSTGRLNERNRQDLLWAHPSVQWSLSPRSRLLLRADYVDASYAQQTTGSYIDYTDTIGSMAWVFDVTTRSSLTLSGTGSKFTPDNGIGAKTYGFQTDWSRRVTEKARYYFRVGVNRTQFDAMSGTPVSVPSSTATTVSSGAGVNWAFQVTGVFLDATRNVAPNSAGYAVEQDQLRLRLQRRYSDRLAGFIGAVGVRNDALGNSNTFVPSRYISGALGFEWRVQRAFAVVGSYSYAWQKFADSATNAKANAVRLAFVYEPHRSAENSAITTGYSF